jgi:hypothetical protein
VVAIVTGVLLGVVLLAGSAQAFRLFRADWSYKSRPMGEPWQVCTAGMPAGFAATIRRAASTWNYRGFRFTFKSNGCSSGGGRPRFNGVNQIGLGSGLGRGVLASTTRFYNRGSGQMLECDLRFNDAQRWYVGRGNVHCLGLEHSGGRSTVMSPTIGDGVARRRLGSDDIAGRAAIYGR